MAYRRYHVYRLIDRIVIHAVWCRSGHLVNFRLCIWRRSNQVPDQDGLQAVGNHQLLKIDRDQRLVYYGICGQSYLADDRVRVSVYHGHRMVRAVGEIHDPVNGIEAEQVRIGNTNRPVRNGDGLNEFEAGVLQIGSGSEG